MAVLPPAAIPAAVPPVPTRATVLRTADLRTAVMEVLPIVVPVTADRLPDRLTEDLLPAAVLIPTADHLPAVLLFPRHLPSPAWQDLSKDFIQSLSAELPTL